MADPILSPNAFLREQDISFRTPEPSEVSTALVGPTVKGRVNIPTIVRSMSEYKRVYGDKFKSGSSYYVHLTTIAAEKFFEQGGTSLLVTRVAPGTFTSAQAQVSSSGGSVSFTIKTLGEGKLYNNFGTGSYSGLNGSLVSGSADNLRWEITSVDSGSGTFSLVVRRGDDNHKNKVILETWSNLSLDPNSDTYIAKEIGDVYYDVSSGYVKEVGDYANKSKYIRISAVNSPTPDYFDNNGNFKPAFTGSLPVIGSGSAHGTFTGATGEIFDTGSQAKFFDNINSTNTQGLTVSTGEVSSYNTAITLLSNTEEFQFNVLLAPGINHKDHSSTAAALVDLVEERGDAIYPIDLVGHGATVLTVTGEATQVNSSYSAAYWPWVKVKASAINREVWVPASTIMGGIYVFTDTNFEEWFAPAGFIRGGIPGIIRPERKLQTSDRNILYPGKVNPIADFPGQGPVIWGQKTLQSKPSALDRVNVRRLLIALKRFIGQQARNITFEANVIAVRNRFLSIVSPFLDNVVQRQGLYAYRIVMDDTNNSADIIDRNQIVGQIYIKPTRTAEFAIIDFVIEPTGTTFEV